MQLQREKQRLQLDVDAKDQQIKKYNTLIDQSDEALNKMIQNTQKLASSLTAALDDQAPNQETSINSNPYELITCDDCNEVTVPRHQINHHKNESCFAKVED